LVVFSGGRDSSAVLAVATSVARRNGLADPVPATNRFRGAPGTEEREWQEIVVSHLRLPEWHVKEWDDEHDIIGPVAQQVLLRWGPVYPHNAHFALPLLEAARGGSALTGVGGDEIFSLGPSLHAARLLTLQVRARWGDWRALAAATAPPGLRRRWQMRHVEGLPWLTEEANHRLRTTIASDMAYRPMWFGPGVRAWLWRERSLLATKQTLSALATERGVSISHPLADPGFLACLATARPRTGYRSRDQAMEDLFGELLPPLVLRRQTKAAFNDAFFSTYSRKFARHWDGKGFGPDVVDAEALRRTWAQEPVDARSFNALQGAWLWSIAPAHAPE
jgi:asparagine synthase (glutamine-hydrolysing)